MQHPLTKFREARGISISEMAERCGVSRQSIYRIEKQQQTPSLDLIGRINSVTGGEVPPAVWFSLPSERANA